MLSLKPPWKQKNPIMEKACQAYHRNRAPTRAREIIESIEAKGHDVEIINNAETPVWKSTQAAIKRTRMDEIRGIFTVRIFKKRDVARIELVKTCWDPLTIYVGEKDKTYKLKKGSGRTRLIIEPIEK